MDILSLFSQNIFFYLFLIFVLNIILCGNISIEPGELRDESLYRQISKHIFQEVWYGLDTEF